MSKLQELQQQAAQAAEYAEDMNEAVKGGGGRLLPAGYAFGRLVEVVEFGNQPQEFNGVAKDPAPETQLGFALWGEGYQNEDGTPYISRLFPMAISRNDKARAFKLFKLLNWKGTAKTFPQLLGEAWLVKIVHAPKSKTDNTLVSRIDLAGFLPPLDPVTKAPYPIPAPRDEDLRLFLWNTPTMEGWASLYIEGQFDDGGSKNRLQEKCLAARDFAGSPLEQMLAGNGLSLPESGGNTPVPALPAGPSVPVAPATVPSVTASALPVASAALPAATAEPAAAVAVPQENPPQPAAAVAAPLTAPAISSATTPAVPSAAPASQATTSPSNVVMPVLPTLPVIPGA